jgi:hypothetical protein
MNGTASTEHTGRLIPSLVQSSNRVRNSSVDEVDVWTILTEAREHLCAHVMTAGDVQAVYLIGDVQERVIVDELKRLNVLR